MMYLIGEKRAGSGEEWGLNIWREEGGKLEEREGGRRA